MKIGISITSNHMVDDVRAGARHMIDRARAAAGAGLDSIFVGDHHVVPSPYYQNTPIMGRLLAEWDHRTSGVLFLLPLWNPVLAAEQISTLACIAEGPFVLQCGLGRDEHQFNAMGANIKYRPSAFEQSIEVLRALWQGETVSLDGRWQFQDASISPLPPEPISIWIGASAPPAIERAARIGDTWLADPSITLDQAASSMDLYQRALNKFSRTSELVAIRRDVYVAESLIEAEELRRSVAERGYRGFNPAALVIGSAEEVATTFQSFGDLGYTDIIIRNLHRDPQKALDSTHRMANVVKILST